MRKRKAPEGKGDHQRFK